MSGMDTDTQTHNDTVWADVNETTSLGLNHATLVQWLSTKGNDTITCTVIKTYTQDTLCMIWSTDN